MMEDAFFNWISDARREGNFLDEDIERVLIDKRFACNVFEDFASDLDEIAAWVQKQVQDWKDCQDA